METSSKIRIGGMALVSVLLFAPKAIAAANQDGTELATSQTVMSFDESIAGWHGNVKGGIVLTHDRNVKKRGAGSLRIDGSQPGSFGAPLALARNQPYRIGCWVKTDGRCVLRPYLSVEDAKQQRYGVYSGPPLNSTSFAYFEVGFHPSMMARDGRDLHLRFQELVPGTAWVDEVTVTMMDPVPNAESGGIRVYGGKRHAAITAPWVRQPPDIDGVPDEAVWGGVPAMVLEDYISAGNAQGEARIVCDGKFLYLAIECPEPSHEIMADPNRAHDGDLWQDDSVEVFLAPEHGSETYYQFIVNARGATREAKMGAKAGRKLQTDLAWTCNWTSAVWRGDNRWAVELAIPCHAVEVKPSCLLGVNVCRNYVTAKRNASWARLAGGSVFLSFHQPNLFGKLLLADDQLNVTVRSLGQRQAGQNQLLLETQNEGTVRELSFQVADDDNPTVCTETTQNIPPGKGTVSLPYTLRSGKQDVAILAREKGRGGVPVFDLAMLRVRAVGPDALALQSIRDKLQFLAVLTKGSSEIADLHKTLGRFVESPPGSTTSECSGQRPSAEEYEAFAQRVEKVAARTMDAKVLAYPDARESLRLAISDARIQGPFEVTDSPAAVSLSPAGWADFGVTIPAAGRYRFEIACGTPAGQKSLPARFALLLNRRVLGTTWCLTKAEDAAAEQFAFVPIGSARVVESGKHVLRVMPLREPTRWLSGVRITLVGDHPGPPILSFVQFTDTHVGGLYYIHRALASCIPDVFRDAATYINDCLKPDFVVATGDVAAAPQEALLKQAAALLSLFKAPCY
ncbi:MAG: hypothetical protein L6437_15830, partial [Kiritimatiellae bacterium]|nr:hypothetical protein [Kiritimatiellia bacterium]